MNTHSLAKNSVYNVLYRLLNILFPLVTSIYVARFLKAESIGLVSAAQNNTRYFTMIASLGIPAYGVKLTAQYKTKSYESSKAFCELFLINGILSVISSIAFVILVFSVPYFREQKVLYLITGTVILFNIINVDWFYQGIQEYGYIAIRSLIVKFFSLIGIILFVHTENDFYAYAIISVFAIIGNYILNIVRIRSFITPVTNNLFFSEHLRHILTLFISSVAIEVYVLADTTMLDFMCTPTIVGYYTMSMRMISVIRTLVVAVSAVFLPQMSYLYYAGEKEQFKDTVDRGIHTLGAISFPVAIGFFLLADDVIVLCFGNEFKGSIMTARILSLSIITVAYSNYIGLQVLVTMGKERITTISTICGAIINILMNYFLIRTFQHNGAAVASATTECVVTIVQILLSSKYIKIHYKFKPILISSIVMALGVYISKSMIPYIIPRITVSILLGMIIYVMTMYCLKDSFVTSIMGIIKDRFEKR